MIYFVTGQQELFNNETYTIISAKESLGIIGEWSMIQFDTETKGRDCHIGELLLAQFGSTDKSVQIVVDCTTVDITLYKDVLEGKCLIGQNLKFDLQWLYNYGIIPRKVYDTMIVEQLLYLGYPPEYKDPVHGISYGLKDIAYRRLGVDIDKTVRGQIQWRGIDDDVIRYAANDVVWLYDIADSQLRDCVSKDCLVGAKLECDFTPSVAYMEWCGIKLDTNKWKAKMDNDLAELEKSESLLNDFVVRTPSLSKFVYIDNQGNLFTGFDLTPKVDINWSSSRQVIEVVKLLGFNTSVTDKRTGEDKDSVLEKQLAVQKGINDEFLKLYFNYQEHSKVVSSFGQGHLNAVNPKTGRIHTTFHALGASSGRLSCGSGQSNTDLAKLNNVSPKDCKYPNIQQLPADDATRGAFVAPDGYNFVSADFSAEESRLAADIYQDKEFLREFTEGSGDTHSMFAWMVFRKECEECGCKSVADVKKLAPQWRKKVKGVELSYADSLG